jgi:glycosyltransferase involved in cell wall biosynthesis
METKNLEKIKIIMFAHASHSYFLGESNRKLEDIIKNDWFAQVARQIKKFYPKIDVECWNCEKTFKKETEFEDNNIKYKIFPTTLSPMYALDVSWPLIKALKKEIKNNTKNGIKTIIHMHEHHNLQGLLIATLFNKTKIISQHHGGSWPFKHLKQTKRYKLAFPLFLIGQIWENIVLRNIDCFFALSEDEINYIKDMAPKSQIKFQTLGIEEEYFKKMDKRTARKNLGIPLNKKMIIYIGRINEIKGIRYLIDAMEELEDVDLKIIGFSQDLDFFRNYAMEKGLKNIEFTGGVFGEKKLLYLSAADALILPSSKEGAPVTIMEALARNLPVVATKVGGIPLMIDNEKNGLLIKPKNKEEIVLGVRRILDWKSKDFKEYANRYKWKNIIEETVKEYKK